MHLGAFSMSLAVNDLAASRAFYEAIGFKVMGGEPERGWLILTMGDTILGLFHGMFEKNMLTFNPGWDQRAQPLEAFDDVREIRRTLAEQGISAEQETGLDGDGPASFVAIDPDGNPVLIDQHVPRL